MPAEGLSQSLYAKQKVNDIEKLDFCTNQLKTTKNGSFE
jgi:hypothetical protein